jgi:hypothetical protein
MAGHQRTADTPADGGRADTPAGGGQADTGGGAMLRIGMHACAMGEGGTRMEPQRGGRERCINRRGEARWDACMMHGKVLRREREQEKNDRC